MLVKNFTVKKIIKEQTFITNVHLLANHLHLSDQDAQTLLLEQYMLVRNKNIDDDKWLKEWNNTTYGEHNHEYQLFKITYARLDIERTYYAKCKDHLNYDNDLLNVIDDQDNEDNTALTDELLDILKTNMDRIFFRQGKKKKYVQCFLEHGSVEADEKYGIGLSDTLNYIKRWSKQDNVKAIIDECLQRNQLAKHGKVQNVINTILHFEHMENYTLFEIDGKVAEVIDYNKQIVEELINDCHGLKHPMQLLKDYPHADNQDKIRFIEYLESQVD